MAKSFLDGANYNFQQREGSGAATVFGNNMAVDQYIATNERRKAQQLAQQQARQKALAERDQRISESIAKLSPGTYSQQFGSAIQKGYSDLIGKAKTLQSQGVDPMTNSEFLSERQNLVNMAGASQELKKQYDSFYKQYGENPEGYVNGLEILQGYQDPEVLQKYMSGEFRPGALQKKYTVADIINLRKDKGASMTVGDGSTTTVSANREENMRKAVTSLESPEAQALIKQRGGDANMRYLAGFPTEGDGAPTWETNKENLELQAIDQMENDPGFIEYLEGLGYDMSNEEKMIDSASEYMAKQNKAVGGYVNSYTDQLSGTVNSSSKVDFSGARERRAQRAEARAQRSHNLSVQSQNLTIAQKVKELNEDKDTSGKEFGDVLLDGIKAKNPEAVEDLQRAFESKGELRIVGDEIEFDTENGKQRIKLSETERIKNLIKENLPSTQYKSKVDGDVYVAKEKEFVNKSGGLMPDDLSDQKARANDILKKNGLL